MIDRILEKNIKQAKDFMELWMKFHNLYKDAFTRDTFTAEEEKTFLDIKSLIARKYQALIDSLDMGFDREDKTFEVVSQILSLKSVAALSDAQIKKIESDWHNSYILFNKILGSLEHKKEELARISTFGITVRKFFSNPFVNLTLIVCLIIIMYYVLRPFISVLK